MSPPVAILGAGMAGLAAAAVLERRRCPAMLIAPPGEPVPARGETLSPRAAGLLDRLGWRDLLDGAAAVPVAARYSAWGRSDLVRDDGRMHGGLGWHVDRPRFEAAMAERLPGRHVRRVAGRVRRVARGAPGWTILLASGERLTASRLVDCTGRAAVTVSRPALAAGRGDGLVAVYRTFPAADADLAPAILIESAEAGWWYSAPVPPGRLFLAYFTDADLVPDGLRRTPGVWGGLLAPASATGRRVASLGLDLAAPPEGAAPASTVVHDGIAGVGVVRAGDAAAAFDPLASNGLATALWSGIGAAEAVLAHVGGDLAAPDAYAAAFAAGIGASVAGSAAVYGMERRFPGRPFWQRRAA